MIEIWQPRWKDRTVLVARYKIAYGQDFKIKITQSAAKGIYLVKSAVCRDAHIEKMKTKQGKDIEMKVIPMDKLERLED